MPNTNSAATNFRAFMVLSALIGGTVACGSSGSNGNPSTSTGGGSGGGLCTQTEATVGCSCNQNLDGGTGICTDTLSSATFQGSPRCTLVESGDACSPGVPSASACSTTNLVGTCFSSDGITAGVRYYSPTYTSASAEAACTAVAGQCFDASN